MSQSIIFPEGHTPWKIWVLPVSGVPEIGSRARRKLAAILVADIVGYSRLVERAETATLALIKRLYAEHARPLIRDHGGRVVKTVGDALIAEFGSAVDAVACAAAMQSALDGAQQDLPADDLIAMRIGVNVGDVVEDDGDLFGDCVVVATRLQSIAAPGGICISDAVHNQVNGRLDLPFVDLGPQALKNIDRRLKVFHALTSRTAPRAAIHTGPPEGGERRRISIAVLPFENSGGEPEKEYLADGIAEDLLLALSRFRGFDVVGRSASFALRGKSVTPKEAGTSLGVEFVIEGSVRWSGARLRLSVRLVETATGRQLWADRFDRQISDIFDVQDEITEQIVLAVGPELERAEIERALQKAPERLDAWDCYYRASWHFHRFTRADNDIAKALYAQSIRIDPQFARGHAGLSYAHYSEIIFSYTDDPQTSLMEGLRVAKLAVSLDPRDAFARHTLGRIYMLLGKHDASIEELSRAVRLNPNLGLAYYGLGFSLAMAGRPFDALPYLERACQIGQSEALIWAFYTVRALAHMLLGNDEEAVFWARRGVEAPAAEYWAPLVLTVALAHAGHAAAAREALATAMAMRPDFTIAMFYRTFHFTEGRHRDLFVSGLALAGFDVGQPPVPAQTDKV